MKELERLRKLVDEATALAHTLLDLAKDDRYLAAWSRAEARRWHRWRMWRATREQYRRV